MHNKSCATIAPENEAFAAAEPAVSFLREKVQAKHRLE